MSEELEQQNMIEEEEETLDADKVGGGLDPERDQDEGTKGLSQEEIDRMVQERLKSTLSPGLRQVVEQDPSQLDNVLRWSAELVERELQQQSQPQKPQKEQPPEKDFLDQAYEYMKMEAMKDQQSGLDEEEIRRRHWRRDMELRTALSERKAHEVINRERTKAMEMQRFFTTNPDYQAPLVANEVLRRYEAGEPLGSIQASLQPLIDQQKAFYGIQSPPPAGQRPAYQPQQQSRRPQTPSPSQWDTYTEAAANNPAEQEDFVEKTKADIKKMIKNAKNTDELFDDKIWKQARKIVDLDSRR